MQANASFGRSKNNTALNLKVILSAAGKKATFHLRIYSTTKHLIGTANIRRNLQLRLERVVRYSSLRSRRNCRVHGNVRPATS